MTPERRAEIERIVGEQFFNETERDIVREIIADAKEAESQRAAALARAEQAEAQVATLTQRAEQAERKQHRKGCPSLGIGGAVERDCTCGVKALRATIAALTQERDEADTALAACQSQAAARIAALEQDCHALKRAIAPASAGPEPWEGMPALSFYIAVADKRREMSLKIRPADAVQRLHNLANSFEVCDECEQNACDDAKPDGPHILCHDCINKHRAIVAERDALRAEVAELTMKLAAKPNATDTSGVGGWFND